MLRIYMTKEDIRSGYIMGVDDKGCIYRYTISS